MKESSAIDYVLAIHAGHNASALVGTPDKIIYAVQEERLTGEKNYWGFPEKSIQACLARVGREAREIKHIVFGAHQLVTRYHSREDVIQSYARQDSLGGAVRQRFIVPFVLKLNKRFGQKEVLGQLKAMGFNTSAVKFYDHHGSHAASAYYGLRKNTMDKYLVLTCDGSGDDLCASVRVMGPDGEKVVATTQWNNSLGALYSWTTFRMGFVPLEHEYKLMGMAPYATQAYSEEIKSIYSSYLGLDRTGLSFERKGFTRISDASKDLFNKLNGKRFDAICGGLQIFTEDLLTRWAANAIRKTGIKKVLVAGGVFMNVKANKLISELPQVEYFEAFPSCGDETLIFGAYYQYIAEKISRECVPVLEDFYSGDDLEPDEVTAAIKKFNHSYRAMEHPGEEVADLLLKGHPVARCKGPMEFGARALGNRSILADPGNLDVVRVINQMVKKRDFWMPFAPMMKKESSDTYIKNEKGLDSPYMMMTFDTRENFRDLIAAVHNADLTCRAQLLTKEQNRGMYEIIDQFEKKSGKGVVLNTSFNLHGYPIARTGEEAMHIFHNSGLEYMELGPYLISKNT
ncbi:MAG: carbamoyltransferase C-terminal domain-containing protein [Cytophagales bacterium]|nr:carbamoyltransferase C-terminal domain-containing protein [Cytophagales bacterium]